jgi:hypothetical protein
MYELTELERTLLELLCVALGIGSYLARVTWRLVRERNYCRELLTREQQRNILKENELLKSNIARHNETLRIVCTAFAVGEPTTLDDLLSSAEHDWSVRSSKTPRD